MSTDTIILNQENQIEMNKAYDEYVKKALDEARVSIKAGKLNSYEKVMNEFMKDE